MWGQGGGPPRREGTGRKTDAGRPGVLLVRPQLKREELGCKELADPERWLQRAGGRGSGTGARVEES